MSGSFIKLGWYRMAVVLCPLQRLSKILEAWFILEEFSLILYNDQKEFGTQSVVKRAWPCPSEVCMLLFLQIFSWAPTLIQVRGVTGKWNCISSVSPLPARLRCLSCLPPQPKDAVVTCFCWLTQEKGPPQKYLGRWSVFLGHLTFAWTETAIPPSLRKC